MEFWMAATNIIVPNGGCITPRASLSFAFAQAALLASFGGLRLRLCITTLWWVGVSAAPVVRSDTEGRVVITATFRRRHLHLKHLTSHLSGRGWHENCACGVQHGARKFQG